MQYNGTAAFKGYQVRITDAGEDEPRIYYFDATRVPPPAPAAAGLLETTEAGDSELVRVIPREDKQPRVDDRQLSNRLTETAFGLRVLGQVLATDGFCSYSDERRKANIKILNEDCLKLVEELTPVRTVSAFIPHSFR